MQYTCEFRTAVVSVQPLSLELAIFASGTRSPAPHQAAMITSGSCRATSSAEHCAPALPRNSPPAACTNSATHGCDAMMGLPHFSENTRFLGRFTVWRRTSSIAVEGTAAITRSGLAAKISLAFEVHESAMMNRLPSFTSATTSAQYFVQATTRSNSPTLARITVALGCRQAIRCGLCESDKLPL